MYPSSMTTTTIKVSKQVRERLSEVAARHGKTMDQTLDTLLAEHERTVQAYIDEAAADEAWMAEIRRRRSERRPVDAIAHRDVVAMFSDEAGE